ncbi:hypothetical protein FOA52_006649 [Chlamydomonas sp. UWO 241]|nr:hypothetical protein FOA52_006649 [Chlamydomonas sp. UWO 241]
MAQHACTYVQQQQQQQQQQSGSPVQQQAGSPALRLTAVGANPVVVCQRGSNGDWDMVGFLKHNVESGNSMVVRAGMRFYIVGKADVTAVELVLSQGGDGGGASTGGVLAAGGVGSNTATADAAHMTCWSSATRMMPRGPITTAIVSNFMIDMEWLLQTAPALTSANQMLVLHGAEWDEANMAQACQQAGVSARTVLHRPHLPLEYGTHHAKFMLLEYGPNGVYPGGLRVIITTANFIPRDCRNKCQGLWWQDFPRASTSSSNGVGSAALPPSAAGDFGAYMQSYLAFALLQLGQENSAWKGTAARLCRDYNFSSARGHLVGSAPGFNGYHNGIAIQRWGHMRVRALLSRVRPGHVGGLGGNSGGVSSSGRGSSGGSQPPQLVLQSSSIGMMDNTWLREEFGASLSSEPGCGSAGGRPPGNGQIVFVWPTVDQVRSSYEGWGAGDAIPGKQIKVESMMEHVSNTFHRYDGSLGGITGRGNAMPHIKSYARHRSDGRADWVMVGSHNLSKSAWGRHIRKSGAFVLRSYELSVLVTPETEAPYRVHPHAHFRAALATGAAAALPTMLLPGQPVVAYDLVPTGALAAHGGGALACVPLPYTLPPAQYDSDGDAPWIDDIGHGKLLDSKGKKYRIPRGP